MAATDRSGPSSIEARIWSVIALIGRSGCPLGTRCSGLSTEDIVACFESRPRMCAPNLSGPTDVSPASRCDLKVPPLPVETGQRHAGL